MHVRTIIRFKDTGVRVLVRIVRGDELEPRSGFSNRLSLPHLFLTSDRSHTLQTLHNIGGFRVTCVEARLCSRKGRYLHDTRLRYECYAQGLTQWHSLLLPRPRSHLIILRGCRLWSSPQGATL